MSVTKKIVEKESVNEERYRSLIEASLDPLFTLGPDGHITDLNEALLNLTGLTRKALIGNAFFKYFIESEKALELFREVLAKGSVANYPLTVRHTSGRIT